MFFTESKTFPYKGIQYDSLDTSSESSHTPQLTTFRSKLYPFAAGTVSTLILITCVLLTRHLLTLHPQYTHDTVPDEEWNHCGRSSKVAIEKGCVMEPLFYGWMPPQCVFKDFSDRFPVFEDRSWFEDQNLTIPIPSEDLWHGKHVTIYTNK
jgi:hypothetical protein